MTTAEARERCGFARLTNSPAGRIVLLGAGIALIGLGYALRGSCASIALILVGLMALLASFFNLCHVMARSCGPTNRPGQTAVL